MAVDIHCMNSPAFGEPDIDSRQCARISSTVPQERALQSQDDTVYA
jgi:hypothetical protein